MVPQSMSQKSCFDEWSVSPFWRRSLWTVPNEILGQRNNDITPLKIHILETSKLHNFRNDKNVFLNIFVIFLDRIYSGFRIFWIFLSIGILNLVITCMRHKYLILWTIRHWTHSLSSINVSIHSFTIK